MADSAHLNIPLSFNQVIELVRQLPKKQQKKIVELIQQDDFELSPEQVKLLDKRSKTPLDGYISSDSSLKALKKKHGL